MKKITLYVLPGSPASDQARHFLEERGAAYTLIDVSKPANAKRLARETRQWAAPVLVVGNEVAIGFGEELYRRLVEGR
jgi:arsenate reductase-like glutaredoxin family protein